MQTLLRNAQTNGHPVTFLLQGRERMNVNHDQYDIVLKFDKFSCEHDVEFS